MTTLNGNMFQISPSLYLLLVSKLFVALKRTKVFDVTPRCQQAEQSKCVLLVKIAIEKLEDICIQRNIMQPQKYQLQETVDSLIYSTYIHVLQ